VRLKITGECFCGALSYEINGALMDARSCHCSRCRKAFSSQASAYAVVNHEEFNWLTGEAHLSAFVSEQGAGIAFCSICGSTLVGLFDGKVHGVTLGCINGDSEVELQRHIFTGSKANWETIGAGTPQYDEFPPDIPGYP
jgi:hypothetical protein